MPIMYRSHTQYCTCQNFVIVDIFYIFTTENSIFVAIYTQEYQSPDVCARVCCTVNRADSRFAPSQWETALLCNAISHWLGASLESALCEAMSSNNYGVPYCNTVNVRGKYACSYES